MLYSYLLTEKHFSLEPQPSQPTKEKRFAYKIYLDTLALMVALARAMGKNARIAANRFTAANGTADVIKAILTKPSRGENFEFNAIVTDLAEEIKASGIYKLYIRKSDDDSMVGDVHLWKELFEHIIWGSPLYNSIASRYENYSLRGMDRMRELMENTFSNFMSSHGGITDALRQLRVSLDAARELYFRLLILPLAITDMRMKDIEAGMAKRLPSPEDINPDMRLTEAPLLDIIRENVVIDEFVEKHKIDWLDESPELIEALLKAILESNAYTVYKATPPSAGADYTFWRAVFSEVICNNDIFLEEMENKSVFWNDDIDIMTEFAIKTLRRFEEGLGQNAVLSMYKDEDDAIFARRLFSLVIDNKEQYRAIIDECLDSRIWESERLAYMDVIIIMTAVAEMLNFPSIPLKVTLNEYIEIAKSYSTSKSGMFVNGLLGVIIARLRRDGKLLKTDAPSKK